MSQGDAKLFQCITLALPGQEPKDQLLRQLAVYLCSSSTATLGPRSCSARIAAEAIHGLPSDIIQLQDVLFGSVGAGLFRVHQDSNRQVTIQLDTDALVQRARQATKTGILRHELPTPDSYVDGVHPIRPGQRDCAHWVKFAECKYGRDCVFNHPEPTYTCYQGSSGSRSSYTSHPSTFLEVPAEHTAASKLRSSSSCSLDHNSSTIPLASNPNMLYTSGSADTSAAMTGHRYHHTGAAAISTLSQHTAVAAAAVEPVSPPPPPPPAAAAASTAAGSRDSSSTSDPPATSAAAAAVCPMFLMRGACLRGIKCLYSHPARGLTAATSQAAQSATPESLSPPPPPAAAAPLPVAAPAAAPIEFRHREVTRGHGLSWLFTQAARAVDARHSLQQQQPLERSTWQDTVLQSGQPSGTDHLDHQEQQQQSQLPTWQQQALQTADLPHAEQQQQQRQQQSDPLTWQQQALQAQELFHAEQPPPPQQQSSEIIREQEQAYQSEQSHTRQQQQQQQETVTRQQQQQGNEHQPFTDIQHRAKQAKVQNKHHMQDFTLYPITGQTLQGNPHRPGAPNCPYYMHIGTCDFGLKCVYHHPDYPPQPLSFVKDGFAAGRWFKNRPVPYSRIVMHLSRIWDYDSCPEAQLKTWMARYLISVANPDCRMWGNTAAHPIVGDDSEETSGSHLGPYSCNLCEAGDYLQIMWLEQPDEDAAESLMPYSENLRVLFSRDPYFQVENDSNNGNLYVKLNIAKLVETLNW